MHTHTHSRTRASYLTTTTTTTNASHIAASHLMAPRKRSSAAIRQRCRMANPAPLGLFGFALTTFVLSCYNAGVLGVGASDPINMAVTLAVFYGGAAQALAGMWEFAYGDTFAATAFASYGAFWLSFGALSIPWFGVTNAYSSLSDATYVLSRAKATYLLGWTIFTFIMLVGSARTSAALCFLFCLVALTLTLLTTAEFGQFHRVHRAGGFAGILTSFVAWYNALAELLDTQQKPLFSLPLGKILPEEAEDEDGEYCSSINATGVP